MKTQLKISQYQVIRFVIQLAVIAVLVIIDRWLKELVIQGLYGKAPVTLIPGFLGLIYAENTGASFSMFSSSTNLLSLVTAIAIVALGVVMLFMKKGNTIYHIMLPLIAAGGLGNLVDRLTRGYVVDYIQTLFVEFPIFNFADCLITVGCFSVIIYLIVDILRHPENKKKPVGDSEHE